MLPDLGDVRWRKSSASGGEGTECVELAWAGAIRDSKAPDGPQLRAPLAGLLAAVKADRLAR
jgi:hypothetical protein